jgi:Flp pilus assembly protein TadG
VITRHRRRRSAAGQALVIMVLAMTAVIAMLGLIIDGGNAWANQRIVQNGSDASAEAGALVMAQRLAGATMPSGGWDAAVLSAVDASAASNGITVTDAYYTDVCGMPLKPNGSAALNSDNTYDFADAQKVGSGLPAQTTSTPNCPSRQVGPVAGVLVMGHKSIQTYFASLFGMTTFGVNTLSTAVSGYLQDTCAADQGQDCAMLPIVFPVDIVTCDPQGNRIVDTGSPWIADGTTVYIVPLCSNGPGNVGWIDWNGTNSKMDVLNSITNPNNPDIPLPSWQNVAVPGNPNMAAIQNAINAYDGSTVLVPEFDETCNPGPNGTPDFSQVTVPQYYGCPAADVGGNGNNQWYRIPSVAHFLLCSPSDPACVAAIPPGQPVQGAYINGNWKSVCNTGNGATSCLVGKFVSIVSTGQIGAGVGGGTGSTKAVSVQLIK